MSQFIASVFIIAITALLQTTHLIAVTGIKPNLVLIMLAILAAFHKNWLVCLSLILIATLIITFSPMITWLDVIFIAPMLFVVAVVDYAPWRKLINVLIAIVAGTLIINMVSFDFITTLKELLMNLALAGVVFPLVQLFYAEEKNTKAGRF